MKKILKNHYLICLFLGIVTAINAQLDKCQVVGWATQGSGVTGGANIAPTVVSNYNDLKTALTNNAIKVVHISGTIIFPAAGRINIQNQTDKSILGLPGAKLVSVDITADGSGIFYVKTSSNLIFRNIKFEGPGAYDTDGNDNMTIDNCTNLWVDHCEFHDGMDGNLDIKNAADLISVTWCTFSYEKAPIPNGPGGADDHRYSNLFGSSDGATGDRGKLRITMQYCWWGEGCRERMPRIRFGKVHMINNYFSSTVANQGIRAGFEADILAEGNFFIAGYAKPIDEFELDYTAILSRNNSGVANLTKGTAFTPPYTLAVTNAADIVNPIKACAGAKLTSANGCSSCGSTTQNNPPTVSITLPTNNQSFVAPAAITINANAADADGSISKVEFYNGTTLLSTDDASLYAYSWAGVAAGTYTITAKATDNLGAVTTSSPITIAVTGTTGGNISPTVSITLPTNNQSFVAPAAITINANAADADGSISKVEFYNGTTLLSTDDASLYAYSWAGVAAGTYTITAKATDNLGAVTTSAPITIAVTGGTTGELAVLTKKGSGSSSQSINQYAEIVSLYYTWTGASTVEVIGLPTGINAVIDNSNKRVDISGAPTVSGVFDFRVNTIGGVPNASKSGTITVNPVTSLEEFNTNQITVFPNPVIDVLNLTQETNYVLQNIEGEVIKTGFGNTIDFGSMLAGIYLLKINEKAYKIVK